MKEWKEIVDNGNTVWEGLRYKFNQKLCRISIAISDIWNYNGNMLYIFCIILENAIEETIASCERQRSV